MEPTTVNAATGGANVTVQAEPERITVGGIVQLIADPTPVSGTFDVEWYVVGPYMVSMHDVPISLLGTTTVTGNRVELSNDNRVRATLDTSALTVGSWRVGIRLTRVGHSEEFDEADMDAEQAQSFGPDLLHGESDSIEVLQRPFAAGDDVAVTLKRTAVPPTSDQALWARIRNSTNAIGFNRYSEFLEVVMCGEPPEAAPGRLPTRHQMRKVKRRTALPFPNVDRYRLLKAATEVFLMVHCGVALDDFSDLGEVDLDEESRRLNRQVRRSDLESEMCKYLTRVSLGEGDFLHVLPYLGLIRLQLRDVAIVGGDGDDEAANICQGIIAEKLAYPCFLELLWSYWHDEGNLARTLNAITRRFQNRTMAAPGRDPLGAMEIDPLRPLSNLLWGWVQDSHHRLTTTRRAFEYDHEYGLVLASNPGPPVRGADSRSRFIESYHNLLSVCAEFFTRDDDTTVIADGFGVLNALKETHIILTQGAHNQYGDLPWTARHEMLMNQWILARPEMRDFLPSRVMVVEPEPWISRVEAMNKLQGWSDVAVLHFRDLAVFGEQLLLSIRFGNWTVEDRPDSAANWARYWRAEIQRYTHAYRAVTGVDLTRQVDPAIPSWHLRRRQFAYRG
jgi:hypothetical protein